MAFNKKQYDYYEWADIEDLFKQLKTQQDRFSITTNNTTPSSKVDETITPNEIQTIYDRLNTLMQNKFIKNESNISIRNVKVPNRFDYLDTTHLSLIQKELDKIAALRPCFTHCDHSSGGGSSGGYSSFNFMYRGTVWGNGGYSAKTMPACPSRTSCSFNNRATNWTVRFA